MLTFHVEIRVNPATNQMTAGAYSEQLINEYAGWIATSEGTLNVPPQSLAVGGLPVVIGFSGTFTNHYFADPQGFWGGNLPPDYIGTGSVYHFNATFDDAKRLVLCPARNTGLTPSGQAPTPVPDADWQAWCLANIVAVLDPGAAPPA